MTMADVARAWAQRHCLPPENVTPEWIERFTDALAQEFFRWVAHGTDVQLRGFGTWKPKKSKNPLIRGIKFQPSDGLLAAVNQKRIRSKLPPLVTDYGPGVLPVSTDPAVRVPQLVRLLFGCIPTITFLKKVIDIAGRNPDGLLHLLEHMVASNMQYDPSAPKLFLASLQSHLKAPDTRR